jgi:hypothetical protein
MERTDLGSIQKKKSIGVFLAKFCEEGTGAMMMLLYLLRHILLLVSLWLVSRVIR